MTLQFNYTVYEGKPHVTLFHEGEVLVAGHDHPNISNIVTGVLEGDEDVANLFDVQRALDVAFNKVSDRVSVRDGIVYFDGDPVNSALTDQIVATMEQGDEDGFTALVNFFENLAANPEEHSREQLYSFVEKNSISIDKDGYLIMMKGVNAYAGVDGIEYTSISRGTATVDGVQHTGNIPNKIGSIVEMPRSEVAHDPRTACHTGLHVGAENYARSFAQGAVIIVRVNPRDVVSVPSDSAHQKMRVCRYVVLDIAPDDSLPAYYKSEEEIIDQDVNDEWDDEDEDEDYFDYADDDNNFYDDGHDASEALYRDSTQSSVAFAPSRPTADNYKKQVRDSSGRFTKSV